MKLNKTILVVLAAGLSLAAAPGGGGGEKDPTIETNATPIVRFNRQAEQETPEEKQDPEPLSLYPDTECDSYEPNDTPTQATPISPDQNGEPTNYTASIQATIHRHVDILGGTQGVDEDYFYFNVYGTANISVSLTNVPNLNNYRLEIFKSQNVPYSTALDSIAYPNGNGASFTYNGPGLAGTYFAKIFDPDNRNYDADWYYGLSVSVSYVHTSETISNARFNKGCKALLWKSDFDPAGIAPFSISDREQVGSYTAFHNLNENRLMNALRAESNGTRIPQAILYVWSADIKSYLIEKLSLISAALAQRADQAETLVIKKEYYSQTANGILATLSICSSAIPEPAGLILSISFTLSSLLVDPVLDLIFPAENQVRLSSLQGYVTCLITALQLSQGVVQIPCAYALSETNEPGIAKQFVDYTPTYPDSGFAFAGDEISAYQPGALAYGKSYFIKDNSDLYNITHGIYQLSADDVNTDNPGIPLTAVEPIITAGLLTGEYRWFHFTPSSDGYYRFYTEGSASMVIDACNRMTAAQHNDTLFATSTHTSDGHNAEVTCYVAAGTTCYFRLHATSYASAPAFVFRTSLVQAIHLHIYTDHYAYVDNSSHRAYCVCGVSHLEAHMLSAKTIIRQGAIYANCTKCNHLINVSGGGSIVAPYNAPRPTGIDSGTFAQSPQIDRFDCLD